MKKKILTAVLSMVLCLGMSTSVFAASSVTNSALSGYAMVNGQRIEVQVSKNFNLNSAQQEATEKAYAMVKEVDWTTVKTDEDREAIYNKIYVDFIKNTIGVTVSNVEIFDSVNLPTLPGVDMSAGIDYTFTAQGISAGDNVIVIHLTDAGEWENIPAVAGNGEITGTFTSLSPVFYAKIPGTAASETHYHSFAATVAAPTETTWGYTMYTCACGYSYVDEYVAPTSAAATTATTSPKTAESAMPALAMMIAFVSVAGIAVVSRRKACVR